MIRIEAITPVKGKNNWYWVAVEGGTVKAPVGLISDLGLYTGKELDDEELDKLVQTAQTARLKDKAVALASRPLSKKEITVKLTQRGYDTDAALEAASWLEQIGAIDEAEYATAIVRRCAAKGYGHNRVKNELYHHGVEKEYWDDALESLPKMDDALDSFLRSRFKGERLDRSDVKKVTDTLYRRGHGWDDISSAIRRYEEEYEYNWE